MDTRINRRSLAVFMLTGAMWVFARRPIVVFMAAILCYLNWEHWFGVRPLRLYELMDVLESKTEATIAAAGLLVAIASITAFRHVKRLDLELAAAAAITAVIRDASAVFSGLGSIVMLWWRPKRPIWMWLMQLERRPCNRRATARN